MTKTNKDQNSQTQPLREHRVFNNWSVVTEGWYVAAKSTEVKGHKILSAIICGQKVVLFRDSKGEVHCMDGYCPHMGVDLGIGKIVDDNIQCFFHHWQFDKTGECVKIPAQEVIPKKACLQTYAVEEKYGHVWVFPRAKAPSKLMEIPGLEGRDVSFSIGKPFSRKCHHHITMINGIDPQHLKTVHSIDIEMNLDIDESDASAIDIELSGDMPASTVGERFIKKVIGPSYSYAMKYSYGCLGALTLMKNVRFFGRADVVPEMYMLFAYETKAIGETLVRPIYLTKKRSGLFGFLISKFLLWATKRGFYFLQGEDGEVYNNIRFNTSNLLPIDAPIARYIGYINRLTPSLWSQVKSGSSEEAKSL
jgi:nitrite reductase/ring-hydroxylating ferredoxin subunit